MTQNLQFSWLNLKGIYIVPGTCIFNLTFAERRCIPPFFPRNTINLPSGETLNFFIIFSSKPLITMKNASKLMYCITEKLIYNVPQRGLHTMKLASCKCYNGDIKI